MTKKTDSAPVTETPETEKDKTTVSTEKTKTKKPAAAKKPAAEAAPAPEPVDERQKIIRDIEARVAAISAQYEFFPDRAEKYEEVDPAELISVPGLDSRAAPGVIDASFLDSLKKQDGSPNLIEPTISAWAKDKTTGKMVRILVAGRRRTEGFIKLGFAKIATITRGKSLNDLMVDAGIENMKRLGLSAWDNAVYMQTLKALGMQQNEIAAKLNISASNVSQSLSLLTLGPDVQKIVKSGKMGPGAASICRELAKVEDLEVQHNIALMVVSDKDNIWTSNDVAAYVKEYNEKQEAAAERAAERERQKKKLAREAKANGGKAPETTDEPEEETGPAFFFDREKFVPLDVPPLHHMLERVQGGLQKIKGDHPEIIAELKAIGAANDHVLKYAEEQGRLKGLKEAAGLLKIPKTVEAAVAEEAKAAEGDKPGKGAKKK